MDRRQFLELASAGTAAMMSHGGAFSLQSTPSLLIRGGTVVTAIRQRADLRIADGRIAAIAPSLSPMPGEQTIDATGLLVLPGGIDPHTHVPGGADDIGSATAAALAGGITVMGDMVSPAAGETLFQAVERVSRLVSDQAVSDVMIHPSVREVVDSTMSDLSRLFAAGHTSVKIYFISPNFDRQAREFYRVVQLARNAGAMTLAHCEDYAIVTELSEALIAQGKGSAAFLPDARPPLAEVVSVERFMALSEQLSAPVYVVHLSCQRALAVCREARRRGIAAYVETRPTYLHLTRSLYSQPEPALYVSSPPLRDPSDVDALWQGLKEGAVHTLGSDHSPVRRADKLDPSLNLLNFRPGFSNLDVMLPMFYSEGVAKGRISLEQFVAVTSTNPAKLFGLYPVKGTIAVGSDADLALWDPSTRRTLRLADLKSKADFFVYEGVQVTGWPRITIRRGEVACRDGQILAAPGSGRLLKRQKTQPLT